MMGEAILQAIEANPVVSAIILLGALVGACYTIWHYFLGPFGAAVWAAIKAAPQIADDVRDLPELVASLRELLAANIPRDVADLKERVARIEERVENLRNPPLVGGEDEQPEPFMLTDAEAFLRIQRRLRDGSHIPGPEES